MKKIPLCWKCTHCIKADAKLGIVISHGFMVGCTLNRDIRDYNDARKLCPIIEK